MVIGLRSLWDSIAVIDDIEPASPGCDDYGIMAVGGSVLSGLSMRCAKCGSLLTWRVGKLVCPKCGDQKDNTKAEESQ